MKLKENIFVHSSETQYSFIMYIEYKGKNFFTIKFFYNFCIQVV